MMCLFQEWSCRAPGWRQPAISKKSRIVTRRQHKRGSKVSP